jgi:hypothetical protein
LVDRLSKRSYNTHIDTKELTMREMTSKLIAMMDEGLISAEAVAEMALAYMSEDDVADMMRANDILLDERDDEDPDPDFDAEPDVDEATEWADFDPDC